MVLTTSCVYHPQKFEKIRVVFDCNAQYANMSINTELMSGTDLANEIVGVLLRFRKEHVAFMTDIESNLCFTKFWYLHTKDVFYAICGGKKATFQRKLLTIRCAYIYLVVLHPQVAQILH